ncbi:MAG: hypothetical protein RML94_14155 [Bacteroidia bacterium]|nr:hypothetical protein [Bacteroidia bacterium]
MVYPASQLGLENILRDVHDPVNQTLRTTATATLVVPPAFDVDMSHLEDSVRLGDGNNFITSTTHGGKVAIDIMPINALIKKVFDNITITAKNANGDPLTILYKLGMTTVATLSLTYDSDGDLQSVSVT